MAKTHIKRGSEAQGSLPACKGARLRIAGLEITKTKEKQHKMYVVDFEIVEPKKLKGSHIKDYLVIGTEDDPRGKKEETWERQEAGPGRMVRLFNRAGVGMVEDDDEWEGLLQDAEIIAPITVRKDEMGERNNVGKYYRSTDDDCPEIGLADDTKPGKRGSKAKADDDDDAPPAKKASAEDDDDAPRKKKAVEEDDDAPPKKKKAADDDDDAPRKKKSRDDDDDDPPKKRRNRDDD